MTDVPNVADTDHNRLLAGDVVVVTGAAQGNGAAIAHGLAKHGAVVAMADRDAAKLQLAVDSVVAAGGRAQGFALDVSDMADCERFANEVQKRLGPASVIVNNAGIVRRTSVEDDGFVESMRDLFEVNTLGSAHMVKALLPQLKQTKGRVINIGSIASFAATTGGVAYGASKGGVLLMTKTMAAELAPLGIRVNGVAPGLIVTPMTEPTRANPDASRAYLEHIPMKRFGEAAELVGPVLFLASDLSSYVTGIMLPVDGGYLAL